MFRVVIILLLLLLASLAGMGLWTWTAPSQTAKSKPEVQRKQLDTFSLQQKLDAAVRKLKTGEQHSALQDIRRLTALEPVFVPAHRVMAEHIIKDYRKRRDLSLLGPLFVHLEIVAKSGDSEAKLMLGRLYAAIGRRDQAIKNLSSVLVTYPEVGVMLSSQLSAVGDRKEAESVANQVVRICRDRLEKNEHDLKSRLTLADNLGTLRRFKEAAEVLLQGEEKHPVLDSMRFEFLIKQADAEAPSNPGLALSLLKQASSENPTNEAVWTRIVSMANGSEESVANEAERYLTSKTKEDDQNVVLWLVLGRESHSKGEYELAIERLERAHLLVPNDVSVVTLLSDSLAKLDPPRLERAMQLCEESIEFHPERIDLIVMRAKLRTLSGQYDEAAKDLEVALTSRPNDRRIIQDLVNLYEAQSKTAKANAMRIRLDEMKSGDESDRSTLPDIFTNQESESREID